MFSLPPTYQPEASSSCLASPPSFPPYPSDPFSEHTAIRISDLEAIVNTSSLSPSFNSTDSDESDATSALLLLSSPSSVNAYDETSTTSPPSRPLSTPRPVIYDENDARSTRLRERGYTSAYYCWHRVDIEAWHHAPISTSIDPALYNFWFFGERAVRKEGQLDKKIIVNWNEFANGRSVYDIIAPQPGESSFLTNDILLTYAMYQIQNFGTQLKDDSFLAVAKLVWDFWFAYEKKSGLISDKYPLMITMAYIVRYRMIEARWRAEKVGRPRRSVRFTGTEIGKGK